MADQQNGIQSTSTLSASRMQGFDRPGGIGLSEEDEAFLRDADVHVKSPAKPMRLRKLTVMCMIFNRMIGGSSSIHSLQNLTCNVRDWNLPHPSDRVHIYRECWSEHVVVGSRGHCSLLWYSCLHGARSYFTFIPHWGYRYFSSS
jgi:hypothetical protein